MNVKIFRGMTGDLWYWHLRARNGKLLADGGEGYKTKWGARRAARKVLGL